MICMQEGAHERADPLMGRPQSENTLRALNAEDNEARRAAHRVGIHGRVRAFAFKDTPKDTYIAPRHESSEIFELNLRTLHMKRGRAGARTLYRRRPVSVLVVRSVSERPFFRTDRGL